MKRMQWRLAGFKIALPMALWLGWQPVYALGESPGAAGAELDTELCGTVGKWVNPDTGEVLSPMEVFRSAAGHAAILLGESHANAEDHRWQLYTSSALRGLRADMVLGFEMFPRSVQEVLDRWVAGELGEREFLEAVGWERVWGYDAKHYLPLFHFARQNRIPMVALNVDRSLVARVGREGWEAVPADEREGVGTPAAAPEAYRLDLAEVYLEKSRMQGDSEKAPENVEEVLELPEFENFVAAQLTWDRAMAEALVAARERHGDALAVGIMGRGHVLFGHGVAHQMSDLGVDDGSTLLPVTASEDCSGIEAGMADAVFVVAESERPEPRPLLGVLIEPAEQGVKVVGVSEMSVAERAGIEEGDYITKAAGLPTARPAQLQRVIRRQAPGTWLPLELLRDDETLEIVAKFPTKIEAKAAH